MARFPRLPRLEPTPESVFFNRRTFLKRSALTGIIAASARQPGQVVAADSKHERILAPGVNRESILEKFSFPRNPQFDLDDLKLTDPIAAGTHNNFYEFLPGRAGPVWRWTKKFKVDPWKLEVGGECLKPRTFDLDDLFKFEHEERLCRHRCVETWAMNVPWSGFPLRKLLEAVEPTDHAKHVTFISALLPKQMPGIEKSGTSPWPYHEALRIDEANHDLAMIVTGIYGKPMPKQHGAPVRLVTPWKYGYKSGKSIAKIELVREQPPTFWSQEVYKHEYGYLSNVNPHIPHPRWSQASEWLLGTGSNSRTSDRRPTEIFNGYGEFVADLYPDEPTTRQKKLRPGQTAR